MNPHTRQQDPAKAAPKRRRRRRALAKREPAEASAKGAAATIDRNQRAEAVAALLHLLPVEELLPPCYSAWKPIVRAAFAYIASRLSPSRLLPKLARQRQASALTLEQRYLLFVSEMPTLQKLGQIMARNPHLDPLLRSELVRLENSIRDVDPELIFEEIRQQLGSKWQAFAIELDETLYSEASVAAIARFSFLDPESGQRQAGVFKVLKPNVARFFLEEISIWDGLILQLGKSDASGLLRSVDLAGLVSDIREHLVPELDYRNEQAHLLEAGSSFSQARAIRIPTLLPQLCTESITAMSFEKGVKVTEAYRGQVGKRRQIANQLIQSFIARPIFTEKQTSLVHADPHAGNILADEETGELILLDWALVEYMSPANRYQIIRAMSAFLLRDELMLAHALLELSAEPKSNALQALQIIREEVRRASLELPLLGYPRLSHATDLVDRIGMRGVRFCKELLIYRKTLLTLEGILRELDPQNTIAPEIAKHIAAGFAGKLIQLQPPPLPLDLQDTANLLISLLWMPARLQLKLLQRLAKSP